MMAGADAPTAPPSWFVGIGTAAAYAIVLLGLQVELSSSVVRPAAAPVAALGGILLYAAVLWLLYLKDPRDWRDAAFFARGVRAWADATGQDMPGPDRLQRLRAVAWRDTSAAMAWQAAMVAGAGAGATFADDGRLPVLLAFSLTVPIVAVALGIALTARDRAELAPLLPPGTRTWLGGPAMPVAGPRPSLGTVVATGYSALLLGLEADLPAWAVGPWAAPARAIGGLLLYAIVLRATHGNTVFAWRDKAVFADRLAGRAEAAVRDMPDADRLEGLRAVAWRDACIAMATQAGMVAGAGAGVTLLPHGLLVAGPVFLSTMLVVAFAGSAALMARDRAELGPLLPVDS